MKNKEKILKRKLKKADKADLKCKVCGSPASCAVLLELRASQGKAINPKEVIAFVCEEHKSLTFNELVPSYYKIYEYYKNAKRIYLTKRFCNVVFEPLTDKENK